MPYAFHRYKKTRERRFSLAKLVSTNSILARMEKTRKNALKPIVHTKEVQEKEAISMVILRRKDVC